MWILALQRQNLQGHRAQIAAVRRQPAAAALLAALTWLYQHVPTGLWAHPQDDLLEEPLTSVLQQNFLSRRATEESRFCNSNYVISNKLVFSQLNSDEIIIQIASQSS